MPDLSKPEQISLSKDVYANDQYPPVSQTRINMIAFGMVFFIVILVAPFGFLLYQQKEAELSDVGNLDVAQAKCEELVTKNLDDPEEILLKSQRAVQDTRFPTHYEIIGSSILKNSSGQNVTNSYKCNLKYSPETKEWTSDTFVSNK